MRFDDTLETVLAADHSTAAGVQSAWRQIVDLVGRGRAPADRRAIQFLDTIRARVPTAVRAASARALRYATPPVPLVRLLAVDDLAVAAPVLRSALLDANDWIALLPELAPSGRAVLRHRGDLPPSVQRALTAFGPIDFILPNAVAAEDVAPPAVPEPTPAPRIAAPSTPFVAVGAIARNIPVVAEALRQAAHPEPEARPDALAIAARAPESTQARAADATSLPPEGPFEISDVVARIETFWRKRQDPSAASLSSAAPRVEGFRFETDAAGIIRWVDGVARTPLIGLAFDLATAPDGSHVDGVAAGAFRRRAGFTNARMMIAGDSDAGGEWRISAVPVFDSNTGRFTGFRGTGRRPRADERAQPPRADHASADSLRQLVHELRTPTNAIAGFAEMIEAQMLGPVAEPYRAQAGEIRAQARHLLGAIDDLDLAARIETRALALYPTRIVLRPLLATIVDDLLQLTALRGSQIVLPASDTIAVTGDGRAVERLLARLLATLASASGEGERLAIRTALDSDMVSIIIDRPAALADYSGDAMLAIDDEEGGAALLGTGFALRLVRNLTRELGGSMVIGADALTLRLPAAVTHPMEQAHLN